MSGPLRLTRQSLRRHAASYALAAALVFVAALLRWAFPHVLEATPFLVFYPAVVAVAAFGGIGPGLLATVASVLCVGVLFDSTPEWRHFTDPLVLARLAIFAAGGVGVSVVAGMTRMAQAREGRRTDELRASEQQLRLQAAALEAAANGIAITNSNGVILYVNSAFTALTGYTREEVIGQTHRVLKSTEQDEPFYRDLWETIRRGEVWRGQLVNRRKDGSLYRDEQSITPLKDSTGQITHYVAVKQDITARKRAEEALVAAQRSSEQAKAAADAASHAKDHFLAVLSHELRTPLTPVVAAVSMLQKQWHCDAASRETLEMIRRNVELEARLIDDLLDVTRIAQGKIELDRKLVDLGEVVRRAIEVCAPDIEARHLRFEVDLGQRPHWVKADIARLQQVFWNLIKNAIKFTPNNGCISVRCHRTELHVVVEVADSGMGIEPEALPRIFNAFDQAERSITRQFGGLGLGLTISRALVEMHGGLIEAHSDGKGKGATFRVRLPSVDRSVCASVPGALSAEPMQPIVGRRLRILLVEDHGDTARIMCRLLTADGHQVQVAGDMATALELAAAHVFDLLLSDLGLPDGSGIDLMLELRLRGHTMPGIALSGYGQEQDIQRSREAGFATHLTKPTSPDRLAEAIADAAS